MLIAAPSRWDEACFAIPAVRALAASGLKVGVLCEEPQQELWQSLSGIEVVGFPPKAKAKVVAAEIAGNWDAAILWEAGVAAEACVRAKIPRLIGLPSKELKSLLTDPVTVAKPPAPVEHRVQYYLSVVGALGIATAQPEFFAPAFAEIDTAPRTVLLSPDSDFGKTYEWLADRWLDLGKTLMADGLKLTVAGIPGGRNLGKSLAIALGDGIRFVEAEPLAGMMELLAVHETVISAESSLPHVAAHAGATCVTLFGPGEPLLRRPLGRRNGIARRHVECSPCFLTKCPMDLRCQNDLTVERVLAVVREKTVRA